MDPRPVMISITASAACPSAYRQLEDRCHDWRSRRSRRWLAFTDLCAAATRVSCGRRRSSRR
eukprot:2922669-Prymnesium_polylepis.1